MHDLTLRTLALAAGIAVLAGSGWASADPPSRVARLGYMTGAVSFSPAGENDWVHATVNRPMTSGDRLWLDNDARAEIQVGGAIVRMAADTGVSVLNLDDRIAQLQLTQGALNVRVRHLEPNQVFEVATPNLAFTVRAPAAFRIEVDPDGNATTIVVRSGRGEVYGEGASYIVDSRQPFRFMGTGLREYEYYSAPRGDEFDRWASDRDRIYDNSVSARYVSRDVIGYQDLDEYGAWRVDATYGNVWFPSRVDAGWAPYRDGHWAWVDPWGWTWVDDAPWGFAVTHYGRWTNLRGTWGWIPGPVRSRAYYAPALVVFVGGDDFQLSISGGNVGGIGWFPLGPREVYRPSYQVSRGYFENVNRSNTVINTTVINNYYNNVNVTNVVYANRQVPGAVIAVPTTTFVQSQPVARTAVRVSRERITSAPVVAIAPVAPTETSVRGAARQGNKPPARAFERPVVARNAPPSAPIGFAAQQQQLTANRGKPLDAAARRDLKPAATATAPVVRVVTEARKAPPTARPPAVAAGAKPGEARARSDERRSPAAPVTSGAPEATPPASAAQREQRDRTEQRAQPAVPPSPATGPAAQREQRDRTEQRAQPAVPPSPATGPAAQREQRDRTEQRAQPAVPPSPATGPAAQREQRDRTEQRAQPAVPPSPATGPAAQRRNGESRGQPAASAPQRAVEPQAAPQASAAQRSTPGARDERNAPAVAARQADPRPLAEAPKSTPPAVQSRAAPRAQSRDARDKAADDETDDPKKARDNRKREQENRTR
ncbi:hypothetical protein BURK1_02078 [Burkholderiales bacterium]|nr:hypothetical protein BURK1_02078 [Burkholderiales bacterium]